MLGFAAALSPAVAAQLTPIALGNASGSGYDVWTLAESDGTPQAAIEGVEFLPIRLVGYPLRDGLRPDLPTAQGRGTPAPYVRLPGWGSLFRVSVGGSTALLTIGPDGAASLRAPVPNINGSPAIQECLAVRADGHAILLATTAPAGGDVALVDLDGGPELVWLTSGLPPLEIEAESLRLSAVAAWFVAGGTLYRTDLAAGTPAAPVDLPLPSGSAVHPDLLMCAQGHRVGVVAEDDQEDRLIFVVPKQGLPVAVATEPADYDTASEQHPLGPFMAINEDGTLLAYRRTLETLELFVEFVEPAEPPLHLTAAPDFPDYIDNVGVLGFAGNVLTFFAGDAQISGVDLDEMIGAGDMFRAVIGLGGDVEVTNVTATGGGQAPPYSQSGTLQFSDALFDPLAQRYILIGESPAEDSTVTIVDATIEAYGSPVVALDGLVEDPQLIAAGLSVLIVSGTKDDEASDSGKQVRIDLLNPKHGEALVSAVALLPAGLWVDRFAISPLGDQAACVLSAGDGYELPLAIALPSGLLSLFWMEPMQVAPLMAFSPQGALVLGLGPASGPFKFALLAGPAGVAAKLPSAQGFALPR